MGTSPPIRAQDRPADRPLPRHLSANRRDPHSILILAQKDERNGVVNLSKALLSFSLALFVMAGGCTTPGMHRAALQNAPTPRLAPKLPAVYTPPRGDHRHLH